VVTAPDLVESMRALTRAEYDRIVATGVFDEDEVELIVEVRTEPTASGYAQLTTRRRGETIALAQFADVEVAVRDLLR